MEKQELEDLLNFSKEFRKKKEEEENKLPYHVNIIDELHINENGHSRVLTKLLQYKNEKNEYEILQSLLDSVKQKNPNFGEIKITNPTITQEKERIDLWVRDDDYAIIFENKVYNAEDQDAQICRYIERTKEKKYKEEQIFVIYLSRDGKEPDSQSWGEYKESFKSRYINLSFRYDILPWLKSIVIPNVRQKDVFLSSALLQYVDYLEGNKMFRTGSIYYNMNMELNNLIEEHYNTKDIDKLLIDKDNISLVVEQMNQLCNKKFEDLYDKWRTNTETDFKTLKPSQNGYWPITQVTIEKFMECGNVNVSISGGHTDPYGNFYVGIAPLPEDKREMVREKLKLKKSEIELPNENQGIHRCFGLGEYNEAYSFFKKLINECKH
ncbi:MAG: PD-(D/E)XK nuclease family protein [Bacteroidales bacterium]|nr:PD-(D/E)XK nuclease family protein [Bacteroidales bacterium]